MDENLEYMDPDDVDIFGPPILSWVSLSKMNFPNQDWRIAGLVPESGVTLLAGVSGEKKTWLAMYMAYCMATGSHLFGSNQFPVKKSKVLYFDAEMAPSEFQRRGKLLQFDNIPPEDLHAIVGYNFSIREDQQFDLLK